MPAIVAALVLAGLPCGVRAQEPPARSTAVEEERVNLVILDVVVVDREGNTVADLSDDDFEIHAGGKPVPLGSLDVACPAGAAADPRAVQHARKREQPVLGEEPRKIVLAVDYLHLGFEALNETLMMARDAVQHNMLPGDEVMVVALNGGLRIEQPFTPDPEEALASLKRMEHDITLWNGHYAHLHESVFVDPLVALLDSLGQVPGNKAIVLYSTMRDVPLDLQFQQIAAVAAVNRCSIYPVDAGGLRTIVTRAQAGTTGRGG